MILTDSHCHLAMVDAEAESALLERARAAGVRGFVAPGTTAADSAAAVQIAYQSGFTSSVLIGTLAGLFGGILMALLMIVYSMNPHAHGDEEPTP